MPPVAITTPALSVTQYASRLERAVLTAGGASLEGEVQKVQRRPNGMLWFGLTDGESVLQCKVFAQDADRLEHPPADGDLVRVRVDRADFWKARGSLTLIVSAVSLAGEGELLRRRAELLSRLESDGLCDRSRWRRLPAFPRAVGVIAGDGSDGMSDVVRALADRWPSVHVITCPCLVQGKAAPFQLIDALATLAEDPRIDVIVMARGGGSVQDLACFDDERLCRALFASAVPVVCAVGHTDNNPLCNHVTWAAFTPSRSAEMIVPSAAELRSGIRTAVRALSAVRDRTERASERLDGCVNRLNADHALAARKHAVRSAAAPLDSSVAGLAALSADIRALRDRVQQAAQRQLREHERDHARGTAQLLADCTRAVSRREARARETVLGDWSAAFQHATRYAADVRRDISHASALITARDFRRDGWLLASTPSGHAVSSVRDLAPGDRIELHLRDGVAGVVIDSVHPQNPRSDHT